VFEINRAQHELSKACYPNLCNIQVAHSYTPLSEIDNIVAIISKKHKIGNQAE